MIPIKYIGKRPVYRDGAYGSGMVFAQGETVNVEDDNLARKFLRHGDVYVAGSADDAVTTVSATAAKKDDTSEDDAQSTRDTIANMTKTALKTFAKTHYSVDLDQRKSVAEHRAQVTNLFEQFGIE